MGAAGSSQKQVFVSYSHEPVENAKFVRWLAGNLRIAGFSPWLDEEKIPAAEDLQKAIWTAVEQSDVGLFIVSNRWEARQWTNFEVELFGAREKEGARKVILEREPTVLKNTGLYLARLKKVSWFGDDPSPHARFWEIYCGIEGIPPGSHDTWEEKGAKVLRITRPDKPSGPRETDNPGRQPQKPDAGGQPPQGRKPDNPAVTSGRAPLGCKGRPVASIIGTDWSYIVTDEQEWIALRADGAMRQPAAALADHAAAIASSSGDLLVGLYSSQVARMLGDDWQYLPQEGPVLSLCACPDGDLAGTASGAVVQLKLGGKSTPLFRMRDPVIGLAPFEGGVAALGSRGAFGRISWPPHEGQSLLWIETGPLGRPAGFFATAELDHIGIYSSTRIGSVHPVTGALMICPHVFDDGIREVIFFGAQRWPYGVLTDTGSLVFIDSAMYQIRSLQFPGSAAVRGCVSGGWNGVSAAWTADGAVYRLSNQSVSRIADGDVVLAYSPAAAEGTLHIVRWTLADGASVEIRGE